MSKIGMGELILILVIAIIVLGPDKIPQLGRSLGKAIRSVKKYVHETTKELEIDELKDIKKDVDDIQKDLKSMGQSLEKSIQDDADAVEKELKATEKDLKAKIEEEPADEPVKKEPEAEPEAAAGPAPEPAEAAGQDDNITQEEIRQ